MKRHKVFICYSRKDKELFDELLVHLDPFKNQGLLEVWTDEEIRVGEDWERRIYRAIDEAAAAVVLVSPNLLASKFVREEEIPRLLRAREERELLVAPLFLRPSGAERLSFELADGRRVTLGEIQGANQPSEPLEELPRAARDRVLGATVTQVLDALRAMPETRRIAEKPRRELTVVLELRDGHVVRRCGHPPWYDLAAGRGGTVPRRWQERPLEDLGRELFRLLLGGGDERAELLGKAYGREVPDPLRHAFRLRVRTDDEELRALPWAACRWRQHLLIDEGWTFELAAGDRPRPIEHLHTPCRALMVAAGPEGLPGLLADAHQKSLEGILARAWKTLQPTLLHRARTPGSLAAELASPPDLLYVYAHARERNGGLELLLADDGGAEAAVTFAELAAHLAARPPRVVVVNTVGDVPLAPSLPGVPAMVHLRHPEAGRDARMAAAAWWEAVLGRELDPVRAFCELPESVRHRGAVTTDYQEWRLDHSEYVPKIDRPRAHLDRRDQRRVARDAVEELVRGPRQRVTCLVAYGAEGNLVHYFAVQMRATLKERATDVARLEPHRIEFPAGRGELDRAAIEELFRETMSLQPSDPLAAAFRAPRRGGPRARPVHFLDWGTFGAGHQEPLLLGHLETWLEFCRVDLEGACPGDARILAYLSLVSGEDRHPGLEKIFTELKLRHHAPHFDLVALPALGTVEAEDLLRFLEDEHNSSCPPAFLGDLPQRIVSSTERGFEATVKLLEETERGNRWHELYEELPAVAPAAELDPEAPL